MKKQDVRLVTKNNLTLGGSIMKKAVEKSDGLVIRAEKLAERLYVEVFGELSKCQAQYTPGLDEASYLLGVIDTHRGCPYGHNLGSSHGKFPKDCDKKCVEVDGCTDTDRDGFFGYDWAYRSCYRMATFMNRDAELIKIITKFKRKHIKAKKLL